MTCFRHTWPQHRRTSDRKASSDSCPSFWSCWSGSTSCPGKTPHPLIAHRAVHALVGKASLPPSSILLPIPWTCIWATCGRCKKSGNRQGEFPLWWWSKWRLPPAQLHSTAVAVVVADAVVAVVVDEYGLIQSRSCGSQWCPAGSGPGKPSSGWWWPGAHSPEQRSSQRRHASNEQWTGFQGKTWGLGEPRSPQ